MAEPWRRLAANATDVALVLALHLAVMGLALLELPAGAAIDAVLTWASPLGVWALVWLCWAKWGATPGKLFWRLRIVDARGGRLGPLRAALRCLAYVLAALPAKIGFLPILWHPLRQGWHDRLAGTLVVRTPLPPDWEPPARPPGRPLHLPPASVGAALRGWWWAALGYVGLSLVMTWPLVTCLAVARPGAPGDGSVFMWNYWFFRHSLAAGRSPLSTDLLFYPHGVSVLYNTMQWFNCLLAWPLQGALGLTATYNVLLLFSVTASAFALYVLATSLCRNRLCGFAAGLAFGFSPYFLVGHLEHQNLLAAQFLPLFALFAYRVLTGARARDAVLAGLSLAGAGLCDWYYLCFAMMIAVSLATGCCWAHGCAPALRRRLALLAGAVLLGLMLLAPLLVPMVIEHTNSRGADVMAAIRRGFKADLLAYAIPKPSLSSRVTAPTAGNEGILTVGGALLVMALIGLVRHRRSLFPWLVLLAVATFAALGPALSIGGHETFPAVPVLLAGGIPGSGPASPWRTDHLLLLCRQTLAHPTALWRGTVAVPLPVIWDWLPRVCPYLRSLKCPVRAGIVGVMALALCAAVTMSALARVWRRRGRRHLAVLLPVLVSVALLAEYAVMPLPMFATEVHPFYYRLAADQEVYAILETPLLASCSEYQFYQTVHHKRLYMGHLSRLVGDPGRFVQSSLLLHCLSAAVEQSGGSRLELGELSADELRRPDTQARLRSDLEKLERLDTRYLIIHRDLLSASDLRRAQHLVEAELGLRAVVRDSAILVYALDAWDGPGTG